MGQMGDRTALKPVVPEQYPFYAIPVEELLNLTQWVPHQKLLAQKKLVNLTDSPVAEDEVIFVSHQARCCPLTPLRSRLITLMRDRTFDRHRRSGHRTAIPTRLPLSSRRSSESSAR